MFELMRLTNNITLTDSDLEWQSLFGSIRIANARKSALYGNLELRVHPLVVSLF
jgi:hypothetical protein